MSTETSTGPIWISEADVVAAVDLDDARRAVREAFTDDGAIALEKTAVTYPAAGRSATLHALGGVASDAGVCGTKTWAHTPGGATPLLVLWDAAAGSLLAVVEAFALGQLRTASVSAVATDAMAVADADVLAIIGSGKQSLPQVAAVASVRPLREVRVFSPTAANRERLCATIADHLPSVSVVECRSVAEAADGAGVVTTATRATDAVLDNAVLTADAHVNAIGAITPERRELAPSLVKVASLVASDSPSAATTLSAELDFADEVVALADVLRRGGSRPDGISVFKAMGSGLADVAVGALVLERVRAAGGGRPFAAPVKTPPRLFTSPRAAASPAPADGSPAGARSLASTSRKDT